MKTYPQKRVGEFIGDYQIIESLGTGKLCDSYLVQSQEQQHYFVMKIYRHTENRGLAWEDRLQAQLSLLAKLRHPGVTRIFHTGKWESYWFHVEELVHDGEGNSSSLMDYWSRYQNKFTHFQLYHLAKQLMESLLYLHQYNDRYRSKLCHGNLKGNNVLVSWEKSTASKEKGAPFQLKLNDMDPFFLEDPLTLLSQDSLAYLGAFAEEEERSMVQAIDASWSICAPEVFHTGELTEASDIFSLGHLLYFFCTGSFYQGVAPLISSVRPDLPEAWDHLVLKCLENQEKYREKDLKSLMNFLKKELSEGCEEELPAPSIHFAKKEQKRGLAPSGMVYIPKGTSWIGREECGEDALPSHEWNTEGFYLDRSPVTVQQFAQFVEETSYVTCAEKEGKAPVWVGDNWQMLKGIYWKNPSGHALPENFLQHPVTQVSFEDAQAYANWLERRLPTEKEWEYAAKGGLRDVLYPWGQIPSVDYANYSTEGTSSVMEYPPNGFGLYDMAGNVWEWTSSWYQAYPGNLRDNPHFGEKYRVVKGGAWLYDGFHCMLAYRNANKPEHSYPTLGFRTACDFIKET